MGGVWVGGWGVSFVECFFNTNTQESDANEDWVGRECVHHRDTRGVNCI